MSDDDVDYEYAERMVAALALELPEAVYADVAPRITGLIAKAKRETHWADSFQRLAIEWEREALLARRALEQAQNDLIELRGE